MNKNWSGEEKGGNGKSGRRIEIAIIAITVVVVVVL